MTDEHIIEEVWEALKHRCCATKPTDPEKWEEVSRIVMFSKDDLRAALAAYRQAAWRPISEERLLALYRHHSVNSHLTEAQPEYEVPDWLPGEPATAAQPVKFRAVLLEDGMGLVKVGDAVVIGPWPVSKAARAHSTTSNAASGTGVVNSASSQSDSISGR